MSVIPFQKVEGKCSLFVGRKIIMDEQVDNKRENKEDLYKKSFIYQNYNVIFDNCFSTPSVIHFWKWK